MVTQNPSVVMLNHDVDPPGHGQDPILTPQQQYQERLSVSKWQLVDEKGHIMEQIKTLRNSRNYRESILKQLGKKRNKNEGHLEVFLDDLDTLKARRWVNSVVINKMMRLFALFNMQWNKSFPNLKRKHYFFYTYTIFLLNNKEPGPNGVIDWTCGNVPIFDYEILFLPSNHINAHWFLIIVYMTKKIILCHDPLQGFANRRSPYLELTLNWLCAEATKKYGPEFDIEAFRKSWRFEYAKDGPFQGNGYDCGVFTIMIVDFLTNGLDLTQLRQKHMRTYRSLITCHLVRNKLHYSLGRNSDIINLINDDSDDEGAA